MCKKINFQIFLLIAIEMAVSSVFSQKKGLGPLGVKREGYFIFYIQNSHNKELEAKFGYQTKIYIFILLIYKNFDISYLWKNESSI